MFGRRNRETQREVCLADARRPEQHDILFALEKPERVQTLDLLPFDARLKAEIEIRERLDRREARGSHRGLQASRVAQLDVRAEELLDRVGGREMP